MHQNLSEQIRLCYERAAEAKQRAEETTDSAARADFLNMERRWLLLARSYQRSESLTDFIRALPDSPNAASTRVDLAPRPNNWEEHAPPAIQTDGHIREERGTQRFEALLLASTSIVWWTNAAGEFVDEQPFWQAYTGQYWEEYRGSRWISCIHPEDRDAITSDWSHAVASGNSYFSRGRIWSAKHNAYRAFQAHGIAIKNEHGEIEEWLGALTDVQDTIDLQRAEQGRQRLVRMLESSFDGIVVRDADDRVISWNDGARELYGWTRDEALGQVTHTLLQTEFPEPLNEIIADVLSDGRWAGELVHRRKDGRVITVFSRWTLERDDQGQRAFILESNFDVTERKQEEKRTADDLSDMTQLNELSIRLVRNDADIKQNLKAVIETAISIARADKGNVQLFNRTTGVLTTAAQCGFERLFLKFSDDGREDASVGSLLMGAAERVVIEDVTTSEILAGQPTKDLLLDAGVRAVVSTPLIDSNGKLLGMISTHFSKPHRPSERELRLIDLLARMTADYLERKRAEEIAHMLVSEIQHRGNNLLAIVQAIATRSLSGHYSLAEAKAAFEGRLQALARTNRQLTGSNWISVNLKEIVLSELQPYSEQTTVEGNDALLDSKQATDFTLALHELATNAAKYGALSNARGTVNASWAMSIQGEAPTLKFTWRETGGPPVTTPTQTGFGTALLKATFPGARVAYAPDGLNCEIDVELGRGHELGPMKAS